MGVGVLKLQRMYPLTLGANIGTTTTGMLAALATSGRKLPDSLMVAFCHLFFNISGIILFYPIPFMRNIPIRLAKFLGNETAKYRWFGVFYLFAMFFVLPAVVFGLIIAGWVIMLAVVCPIIALVLVILLIKLCQNKRPQLLPKVLRTWKWLPEPLRSLAPYDRILQKLLCCKTWVAKARRATRRMSSAQPGMGTGKANPTFDSNEDTRL